MTNHKRGLITGLLIALPLFILSCASVDEERQLKLNEAEVHYKLGVSRLNENQIQIALIEFKKAIEASPLDKRFYQGIGIVYLQLEEYEKAKRSFLKAIQIDPDFGEAYNNLGVTYRKMDLLSESIEAFQKAIESPMYLFPERAFINLGISYYKSGGYDASIKAFKNVLKRINDFDSVYYWLALAYNKKRQYGYAADSLSRAIELDKDLSDAQKKERKIGWKHFRKKGFEEGEIRHFVEILNY